MATIEADPAIAQVGIYVDPGMIDDIVTRITGIQGQESSPRAKSGQGEAGVVPDNSVPDTLYSTARPPMPCGLAEHDLTFLNFPNLANSMTSITRFAAWFLTLTLLAASPVAAQEPSPEFLRGLDILAGQSGTATRHGLEVEAAIVIDPSQTHGRLDVTASVDKGWAIYSLTQPRGGPIAARLRVADHPGIVSVGPFTTTAEPKIVPPDDIIRVPQEKHYGSTTWSAPIQLAEGIDPESLEVQVTLSGQTCHDKGTCVPIDEEAEARFSQFQEVALAEDGSLVQAEEEAGPPVPYEIKGEVGEFDSPRGSAILTGHFEPTAVRPGDTVKVTLKAAPKPGYHVYAYEVTDPDTIYKPTLIAMAPETPWLATRPQPSSKVLSKVTVEGFPPQKYHEGATTWTFELQVPIDAQPGEHPIVGLMGYQTCTDALCDPPQAIRFEGLVQVGEAANRESAMLALSEDKYAEAAELAKIAAEAADAVGEAEAPADQLNIVNPMATANLWWIILFSLIGGAILNLMPCVLPVVGLKIMSFVHQAGKDRLQVFLLNLVYAGGVLFVFMVLAVASSSIGPIIGSLFYAGGEVSQTGIAWGTLSGDWRYIITMTILVFAMGLSLLGVWEIPIPGFLGTGTAGELSTRSGMPGAFFKGIITTLLSVPCSGPFLGPVFGYTVSEPPLITFLVFGCIGLGMASPYVIIGLNPKLVAFLPKPGEWMVTFKQAMGFVMMLTVVYLLFTLQQDLVTAALTMLVGVGIACWMIGRVPPTESSQVKTANTLIGLGICVVMGVFAFNYLTKTEYRIPWHVYAEEEWPQIEEDVLSRQKAGKTVMLEFTADWCPTCKWNLARAIETDSVIELVRANHIDARMVDWSNTSSPHSKSIQNFINKLGSNSIPLLAIFPADRPNEVLVLSDLLQESDVLEKLREAGPSASARSASEQSTAAQAKADQAPMDTAHTR